MGSPALVVGCCLTQCPFAYTTLPFLCHTTCCPWSAPSPSAILFFQVFSTGMAIPGLYFPWCTLHWCCHSHEILLGLVQYLSCGCDCARCLFARIVRQCFVDLLVPGYCITKVGVPLLVYLVWYFLVLVCIVLLKLGDVSLYA